MFSSKIKPIQVVAMAGALVAGTALMAHRALGLPQPSADAGNQQGTGIKPRDGGQAATAHSGSESPGLEAIGKARIEVAAKLRDSTKSLFERGEVNVVEYLTAQKRYDEVVADVMVKTADDRIRYLGHRIATLKRIEDAMRELFRRNQASTRDVLEAELARLDAEYELAKAKANARSGSK
jgi:hypothetical protein